MYRWDAFWADLEPAVGSEQDGASRPVLVVSNDDFNKSAPIVTVLPMTTHRGKGKSKPFEVLIPQGHLDDGKASIVMPHQIRTISKMRLLEPMGRLDDGDLQWTVETAVLEHLGIALGV